MSTRQRIERFRPLLAELVAVAIRLAGVGLVAVGVSGLLAWCMGAVAGKAFVAGDAPGVTYTAARCRDFLEYAPRAHSCAQAAVQHHFGEVVWYRLGAGMLGVVVLAAGMWERRRRPRAPDLLPETLVPTIAAAVFGVAGVWLVGQGVDLVVLKTAGGGGGYLSGGVVALGLAGWFTIPVIRAVLERLPPAPTVA